MTIWVSCYLHNDKLGEHCLVPETNRKRLARRGMYTTLLHTYKQHEE